MSRDSLDPSTVRMMVHPNDREKADAIARAHGTEDFSELVCLGLTMVSRLHKLTQQENFEQMWRQSQEAVRKTIAANN
jgi:hypothetical protein